MTRLRLPNRRQAETRTLAFGAGNLTATVGFDDTMQPRELFLSGAKDGTDMAAILADASVVISVALQCDIAASALAKSVTRVPIGAWDDRDAATAPGSVIGAALELLAEYERGPR